MKKKFTFFSLVMMFAILFNGLGSMNVVNANAVEEEIRHTSINAWLENH